MNFDVEVLNHKGTVLVDFYATWCNPCKNLAREIEKITDSEWNGVKLVKVNVEEVDQSIPIAYGISSIPTLVLFKNGNPVVSTAGYKTKNQILEFIRQ